MKKNILFFNALFLSFIGLSQANLSQQRFQIKNSTIVEETNSSDEINANKAEFEIPKQSNKEANKTYFVFNKQATVTFSSITSDFAPTLLIKELPKQSAQKVIQYNYPASKNLNESKTSITLPDLIKGQSFYGNPFNINTPNDNDFAISDSGICMSAINSAIFMRNTRTTGPNTNRSLAAITGTLNKGLTCFDPKVMYDPKTDRFVFVCLAGFVDTTSRVLLGFSKTNDPRGAWNLYSLPGNPLNNNLWTDYPMIAMTENELFLTVNLLTNNSSWQTGFVESLIWQMKKDDGYAGLPLTSLLHNNIKYNGAPIRNLCPVKGGSKLYGPGMYFLSNRNFASQNDTLFLVNVTNSISATNNTVTVKQLKTNQPYFFPPDGRQVPPAATATPVQSLATNDARNLGAFYENNKIQYVHNTNNPANNQVSVYYGVIDNPTSSIPTVTGYIIPNDTMDFAYPNISYAGLSTTENLAVINFNHSSNKVFAGCSAIESDGNGNFSPILRIQNGLTYVDLLQGNLERWGDYSGSQRFYSGPNKGDVWISGYYGCSGGPNFPRAHGAWLAQLSTERNLVGLKQEQKPDRTEARLFPNPTNQFFSVEFELKNPEYLSFDLYDISGKKIQMLLRDWVKVNNNTFSFDTRDLEKGIYILKITGSTTNITQKVIKE
jgi:hypothetical protein